MGGDDSMSNYYLTQQVRIKSEARQRVLLAYEESRPVYNRTVRSRQDGDGIFQR